MIHHKVAVWGYCKRDLNHEVGKQRYRHMQIYITIYILQTYHLNDYSCSKRYIKTDFSIFSVEILNPGQAILENSTYLSCDDSLVGMLLKKSEDYSFVTVEKEPKAFLLYRLSVMSHQRQKHFPVQVLNQFLKLLLDFPPPYLSGRGLHFGSVIAFM